MDLHLEFPSNALAKSFLDAHRDSFDLLRDGHQYYLNFAKYGKHKVTGIVTGKVLKVLHDMVTAGTVMLAPTADRNAGALYLGSHKVAYIRLGDEWNPVTKKYPATLHPHPEAVKAKFDATTFCTDVQRNVLDMY
jgi:hypothetical protein